MSHEHLGEHRPFRRRPFAATAPVSVGATLRPLGIALVFVVAFVSVFLAALHNPKPHGLDVAVVGPPQAVAAAQAGLDKAVPDGFDVRGYASPDAAGTALRDRDVYGVLDLSQGRTVQISYAGANGPGVTQLVETALTKAAQAQDRPVTTTDVVPLPSDDSRGLSIFYFVFGLALSSFLFTIFFFQSAAGASLVVRLGVPLAFALLCGAATTLVGDLGFGATSGHFWAVAGVSAMISFAVCITVAALTRLIGGAGIGVSALLFIIVGNATSGGALNWHFLPSGWRAVSQLLPSGAGVTALTNVQYFDAHNIGAAVLTLAIWIVAGIALIVVLPVLRLDAVHRAHAGRHEPGRVSAPHPDAAESIRAQSVLTSP